MSKQTSTTDPNLENGGQQLLKMALEIGPLLIFLLANFWGGLLFATKVFMGVTLIALVLSRTLLGRVAVMPIVTAIFLMIFGGLTIWLDNEMFIKLKPTIVNLLFSGVLLGGLFFEKSFLKHVFDGAFHITDAGWKLLTKRWAYFFLVLALLNEIVWRNFSTDTWVTFKTLGILSLTMAFAVSQIGVIRRHELTSADGTHEEH